jgi:hypothetical protein
MYSHTFIWGAIALAIAFAGYWFPIILMEMSR